MKDNIYDHDFEKDGRKCKKVYLNYPPDDTELPCDCCDENKKLASITMLCGDVACICKECLELIIKEF